MLERLMADSLGATYTSDNSLVDIKYGPVGIQLKSTMQHTKHIVWRRASIPDKADRIIASRENETARDRLGISLLHNLNQAKTKSLEQHDCTHFSIFHIKFYEGDIVEVIECNIGTNTLFRTLDFNWEWSTPRRGSPALYGFHVQTGQPWFCWNGNAGNHFCIINERAWMESISDSISRYAFIKTRREDRLTLERFEELLGR